MDLKKTEGRRLESELSLFSISIRENREMKERVSGNFYLPLFYEGDPLQNRMGLKESFSELFPSGREREGMKDQNPFSLPLTAIRFGCPQRREQSRPPPKKS